MTPGLKWHWKHKILLLRLMLSCVLVLVAENMEKFVQNTSGTANDNSNVCTIVQHVHNVQVGGVFPRVCLIIHQVHQGQPHSDL